jgi:biopolymer transport protein ExbD
MAIEKPGRRLFKTIGIDKIRKNLTGKGGRSVIANLNLTAMIDMFTVLVTFLMMLFNAEGDILAADKNIKIPKAVNNSDLEKAVLIQISPFALKFEGETILGDKDPEEMNNLGNEKVSGDLVVAPLVEKLDEKAKELEKKGGSKAKGEPQQVIIQADKSVKYLAITRVMKACADKGFLRINLAVEAKAVE